VGHARMWGINLDSSHGSNTHWVCWFRDRDDKYYFDSYGLTPPMELVKYLQSPIYYNTDQVQPDGHIICGHLCLYVLQRLTMGDGFEERLNNLI
jgi:hypothetical protein